MPTLGNKEVDLNSALVAVGGLAWLYLAYRFYGKIIERKLIVPDGC